MIIHSILSDDYLWRLILRGKQNKKKSKTHPNTKFLPIFQMVGTINKLATANFSFGNRKQIFSMMVNLLQEELIAFRRLHC